MLGLGERKVVIFTQKIRQDVRFLVDAFHFAVS